MLPLLPGHGGGGQAVLQRLLRTWQPVAGLFLDADCCSGCDTLAFKKKGFWAEAFDTSPQLVQLAGERLGQPLAVRTFAKAREQNAYDGIWVCASLLHLPRREIPAALARLWVALKPGGVMYVCFKEGQD